MTLASEEKTSLLERKDSGYSSHDRNSFRLKRAARFAGMIDEILKVKPQCRILDIGGTLSYWLALGDVWQGRDIHVTLVNLEAEDVSDPRFTSVAGNACRLEFPDQSFDIVHSNSVIEHVGRWKDMHAMAGEVRRLAPRYFVQTPNFWFPVEPHFRLPLFHWLPDPVRHSIVMRIACGFFPKAETLSDAIRFIEDATLIDYRRMALLFPDATVERERAYFMTKSLIAIR